MSLPERIHRYAQTGLGARLIKVALAGVVVATILAALGSYGRRLAGRFEDLSLTPLALAFAISVVYRVVNACGWVFVVRALGHPLRTVTGVRIWLTSEALRWLPGSVWGMASRAAQAHAAGVPASVAALSIPIELLLTLAAWGLACTVGLGASGTARVLATRVPPLWVVLCLVSVTTLVAAAVLLVRWRPAGRFATRCRSMLASFRELLQVRPRWGAFAGSLAFFLALCFVNGAAFEEVVVATCHVHPGILTSSGVNAAGWLLGFFAFFAPSGLGVREASMTSLLAMSVPLDGAIAAALLWRVVQIVVELLCLVAFVVPRALAATPRVAPADPECERVA